MTLIALLMNPALATDLDDCTAGVAPAAYDAATCDNICDENASRVECNVGYSGTDDPFLQASSEWGGQDDFTAVWGTDVVGDKFCCQRDNTVAWKNWIFLGSSRADTFDIGKGGAFEFCAPFTSVEVLVKTRGGNDVVEMTCSGGTPAFLDTEVYLGTGADDLDAQGWVTTPTTRTLIRGNAGADTLLGASTTKNTIDGGDGADTMVGGTAIDQICAGPGDDDDSLDGGSGGAEDILYAHSGGYSSGSGISGVSTSNDTCSVIYGGVSATWAGAACDYDKNLPEPAECL